MYHFCESEMVSASAWTYYKILSFAWADHSIQSGLHSSGCGCCRWVDFVVLSLYLHLHLTYFVPVLHGVCVVSVIWFESCVYISEDSFLIWFESCAFAFVLMEQSYSFLSVHRALASNKWVWNVRRCFNNFNFRDLWLYFFLNSHRWSNAVQLGLMNLLGISWDASSIPFYYKQNTYRMFSLWMRKSNLREGREGR